MNYGALLSQLALIAQMNKAKAPVNNFPAPSVTNPYNTGFLPGAQAPMPAAGGDVSYPRLSDNQPTSTYPVVGQPSQGTLSPSTLTLPAQPASPTPTSGGMPTGLRTQMSQMAANRQGMANFMPVSAPPPPVNSNTSGAANTYPSPIGAQKGFTPTPLNPTYGSKSFLPRPVAQPRPGYQNIGYYPKAGGV